MRPPISEFGCARWPRSSNGPSGGRCPPSAPWPAAPWRATCRATASPKGLNEALALAEKQFAPAWEFTTTRDGDALTINVDRCFVRETCEREGQEIGGEMCVLFYNYLAGYLGQMGKVRLRLMDADRGAKCCYR